LPSKNLPELNKDDLQNRRSSLYIAPCQAVKGSVDNPIVRLNYGGVESLSGYRRAAGSDFLIPKYVGR
jgi:hypothetical protein